MKNQFNNLIQNWHVPKFWKRTISADKTSNATRPLKAYRYSQYIYIPLCLCVAPQSYIISGITANNAICRYVFCRHASNWSLPRINNANVDAAAYIQASKTGLRNRATNSTNRCIIGDMNIVCLSVYMVYYGHSRPSKARTEKPQHTKTWAQCGSASPD